MIRGPVRALLFMSLCSAGGAVVHAQDADVGEHDATVPVLKEIVVTAEKRQANIENVPISITAIGGADLQAQGIPDFNALAQEVPGVSLKTSGPGQTEIEMRGMTSTGGESPTVGFYLDEAPVTPPATSQNGKVVIDPDLFDLSRVEILRGPQGTLYGAGSMGGTVRLITNKPDLYAASTNVEANGSHTEGGSWNYGANGMLNVPLVSGKAALRVVATSEYTSGWIDRIVAGPFPLEGGQSSACSANGFYGCTRGNVLAAPVLADYKGVNSTRLDGARALLRIQPFDRLDITATGFYQKITMEGQSTYDDPPGTLAHYQPFDIAEPFSDRFSLFSIVGTYRFDGAELTSASSYWTRTQAQTQDDSEVLQDAFGLNAFATADGGLGAGSLTETDGSRQFSQEVRLASTASDPLRWLVGGYFSHYESTTSSFSYVPGLLTVFGGGVFDTNDFITVFRPTNVTQRAGFGELTYDLTSKLRATVGTRYYSYSSDIVSTETGIVSPSGGNAPTTSYGSAHATGLSPKANLAYQATRDLLVYATAAKGFRPGAGNMPVPVSGPDSCAASLAALGKTQAPLQYQPDTVWSYELGEKMRLLDQRATLNGAAYFEQWNDVQQHVVLGCGFNYQDNAGDAHVYGGELEFSAQLTAELLFTESGGYTHATLSSVTPETGAAVGQRLEDVPSWTSSTAVLFRRPISDDRDFMVRLQYNYVGPMQDVTYIRNYVPGYGIGNARLGVDSASWAAYVYVDNVTNIHANLGNVTSYSENLPTFNRVATNQPRTIGLDIDYRF